MKELIERLSGVVTEGYKIKKSDKKVIDAFLMHKSAEGKALYTDGKRLDGAWVGGNDIAHWEGNKIVVGKNRPHGIVDQAILRYMRRIASDKFESIDYVNLGEQEDDIYGSGLPVCYRPAGRHDIACIDCKYAGIATYEQEEDPGDDMTTYGDEDDPEVLYCTLFKSFVKDFYTCDFAEPIEED